MGSRLTGSGFMGELTARQQTCPPERPPKGGPTDRTLRDLASRLHELEPFPASFSHSSPRPRASQRRGARVQEGRPDGRFESTEASEHVGFAPSYSYSGPHSPIGAVPGVPKSNRPARDSPSISARSEAEADESEPSPGLHVVGQSGPVKERAESSATPPMTPVHLGEAGVRSPPDPRTSDEAARKAARRGGKEIGPSRDRAAPQRGGMA